MKNKRIIYMGTTKFSAYILEQLIIAGYNIVALISQPDRQVGRKRELTMTPTKVIALKYQITCYGFENINNHAAKIRELNPDLIITCAYGQKIKQEILDIPKNKALNVHASLLPKYRGGAPINYAIINGEKITGNTIMYMEDRLDTGAILASSQVEIDLKDTASSLSDKLMRDGAMLLIDTLPAFFQGDLTAQRQDEGSVSYSYNIKSEFEYIDFNNEVLAVYNKIRGLIEIPGPYAIINHKKIKFYQVFYEEDEKALPNKVVVDSKKYFKIGCQNGYILVYAFQIEGKKLISYQDYRNGNKLDIVHGALMNEGVKYENRSK